MDWSLIKDFEIPEGSVKRIQANGVTLWEKFTGDYVYIIPTDLDRYPLQLTGWSRYKMLASDITAYASSYQLIQLNMPKDALQPNLAYCDRYALVSSETPVASIPNKSGKAGTESYPKRLYMRDNTVATSKPGWESYLASHDIYVLYQLAVSDGSNWRPARKISTQQLGYYDETNDVFCPVYGLIEAVTYTVTISSHPAILSSDLNKIKLLSASQQAIRSIDLVPIWDPEAEDYVDPDLPTVTANGVKYIYLYAQNDTEDVYVYLTTSGGDIEYVLTSSAGETDGTFEIASNLTITAVEFTTTRH